MASLAAGVRGEGVRRGNYPCLIEKLTPLGARAAGEPAADDCSGSTALFQQYAHYFFQRTMGPWVHGGGAAPRLATDGWPPTPVRLEVRGDTGRVLGALYAWKMCRARVCDIQVSLLYSCVYVSASAVVQPAGYSILRLLPSMHPACWITEAEPARPMHAGSRPQL